MPKPAFKRFPFPFGSTANLVSYLRARTVGFHEDLVFFHHMAARVKAFKEGQAGRNCVRFCMKVA